MNDNITVLYRNNWCDVCLTYSKKSIRVVEDLENVVYICKTCAEQIAALIPQLEEYPPQPIYEFFD